MRKISCPACGQALYLTLIGEDLESDTIMCRRCHYLYRASYLQVQTIKETPVSKKKSKIDLQCITIKGKVKSITFHLTGKKSRFFPSTSDKIFVLYTPGGGLIKSELVAMVNCTTNSSYRFFSPRNRNSLTAPLKIEDWRLPIDFMPLSSLMGLI